MKTNTPDREARRLAALQNYAILDTPREGWSDDIALIAATITGSPMALITFVDHQRQWFKAAIGIPVPETPRAGGFCSHTILGTQTLVIEDATGDSRFAEHPFVVGDPRIRFYAGAPLLDRDGHALGSLCVIDRQPRQLPVAQRLALEALARGVIFYLEQRKVSADLAAALTDLKAARDLLPICAHCKSIRDDQGYWRRVEEYFRTHAQTDFSHGICPECIRRHFPSIDAKLKSAGAE